MHVTIYNFTANYNYSYTINFREHEISLSRSLWVSQIDST